MSKPKTENRRLRIFTLKQMVECFEAGVTYGIDLAHSIDHGKEVKEADRIVYFQKTFNIDTSTPLTSDDFKKNDLLDDLNKD